MERVETVVTVETFPPPAAAKKKPRAAYIGVCRYAGHHFSIITGKATTKRKHLICKDCTSRIGDTVFVAFGVEEQGFGEHWRSLPAAKYHQFNESEPDE